MTANSDSWRDVITGDADDDRAALRATIDSLLEVIQRGRDAECADADALARLAGADPHGTMGTVDEGIDLVALELRRLREELAGALVVHTVAADRPPPVGYWCVLLSPDCSHQWSCIVSTDGKDWVNTDGQRCPARPGDRYIVLPRVP